MVFEPPTVMRSEPSMVSVGRKGRPMAAARKRRPSPRWLHSSMGTRPDSTYSRMMRESPHGRPIPIQAVTTLSAAPATMHHSPS